MSYPHVTQLEAFRQNAFATVAKPTRRAVPQTRPRRGLLRRWRLRRASLATTATFWEDPARAQ